VPTPSVHGWRGAGPWMGPLALIFPVQERRLGGDSEVEWGARRAFVSEGDPPRSFGN